MTPRYPHGLESSIESFEKGRFKWVRLSLNNGHVTGMRMINQLELGGINKVFFLFEQAIRNPRGETIKPTARSAVSTVSLNIRARVQRGGENDCSF